MGSAVAKEWTSCPECGVSVKDQNLDRHLRSVHKSKAAAPAKRGGAKARRARAGFVFPLFVVVLLIAAGALALVVLNPPSPGGENTKTVAVIQTSMGTFEVELYTGQAPLTTDNFIKLARDGFFDGLIFHRVVEDFVVQGGGFEPGMTQKTSPYGTIPLETSAGLRNLRGTLAMARTSDPNSATSQFYVNLRDNPALDPGTAPPGYAVFGTVISGMDVVDAIGRVETGSSGPYTDVPVVDVVILGVQIVER